MRAKIQGKSVLRHKWLILLLAAIIIVGYLAFSTGFVTITKINFTPQYAQQEGEEFSQNTTIIAYNVTIPQNVDPNNESYFLINGLTNLNYWYVFGIVTSPQINDTTVHSVGIYVDRAFPNGTIAKGMIYGEGNLSYGDKVLLKIYIQNNNTYFNFKDWSKPNLTRNFSFQNTGAYFIELNKYKYFSGLESEYMYYTSNTTIMHPEVIYQPLSYSPQFVGLSITESKQTSALPYLVYNSIFLSVPIGHTGVANASVYIEYSYPNGTFITK